jgi:D-cysteine desulfhydrase
LLGIALAGMDIKVLAVALNDTLQLDEKALIRLATRSEKLLRSRGADFDPLNLSGGNLLLVEDQTGEGYGHATEQARAAMEIARDKADLSLDPVYTGKAMAVLLDLNDGRLGSGPIVFLDTDGPRFSGQVPAGDQPNP